MGAVLGEGQGSQLCPGGTLELFQLLSLCSRTCIPEDSVVLGIIQSDRLAERQWPRKHDEMAPAEVCLPNYIWPRLPVKGIHLPYHSPGRRKRTLCSLEGNDPIWTTCEEQIIKTSHEHNNPLGRNPCNSVRSLKWTES